MRKKLIFLIFIVFLGIYSVYAQNKHKEVIEYLEFREVDIKDVLRQLAKQYNLNIVFSESVSGLVTVQLTNISVEEALDSIITVNGFAYTKKESVIKVTTPEEAEREGKQTKLFKLNNAQAVQLKETLKKVLSSEGAIESDQRSNSLVVTDIPSVIAQVSDMIVDLDKITSQVLIEARFIETTLNTSEKLGIDWNATITASGASRPTTFPWNAWGSQKDMYPTQDATAEYDAGEDAWTITSDFPFRNDGWFDGTLGGDEVDHRLGAFPMAAAADFTFGILDFTEFSAIFDFVKHRDDSKLIANPRITTLDNQKALIQVGKNIPIATFERNEETGKFEITGWEADPERVGIILEVTPQVSPDRHIRLKLKPEVSEIDKFITIEGDEVRPITNTRTAETEVQIRDGQTVVIGGLIKTKYIKKSSKIPFLGDLPLIGLLFQRKELSSEEAPTEQTELLIFVSARILDDTDKPLIGHETGLIVAPPKPFKLKVRNVSLNQ